MRAISPSGNYSIQLFEAIPKRGMDASGTVVEYSDNKPVIAQFSRGGLTEWEEIVALENFDFSALPDGVNPLTRVSVFDTEGLVAFMEDGPEKDAYLEKVDARLQHLAKIFPSQFIVVDKPRSPKPWPSYDETPIEDALDDDGKVVTLGIFSMQAATQIDPQDIRLYEVENENREEVIEACEIIEAALRGDLDSTASHVLQPGETFSVSA